MSISRGLFGMLLSGCLPESGGLLSMSMLIIVTFHRNNSYIEKVNKFIDIEKRDEHSMSKFVNELISLDIYEKLDKQLNSDPNNNFEVLSEILKYA